MPKAKFEPIKDALLANKTKREKAKKAREKTAMIIVPMILEGEFLADNAKRIPLVLKTKIKT